MNFRQALVVVQDRLQARAPAVGRLFQIDHLLQVAQQVGVADGVGWVQ